VSEALLIGGPKDGERWAVAGTLPNSIRYARLPAPKWDYSEAQLSQVEILDHYYHNVFALGDVGIYRHEDLSPRDAIQRLWEAYEARR